MKKVKDESLGAVHTHTHTHTHTGDLINKKRFILNNNIDLNFGENSKLSINNKLYNKKYLNKSTGITIISLIVTIIVLLILAGISISALTSENGIIEQSKLAKENTEISEEKEIIQKAVIGAMGTNKRGNLNKEELRQQLEINIKNKTQLYDDDDNIIVEFNESKRVYGVNKYGDVNKEDSNILMQDSTPR